LIEAAGDSFGPIDASLQRIASTPTGKPARQSDHSARATWKGSILSKMTERFHLLLENRQQ
jgi:hypothetical protein